MSLSTSLELNLSAFKKLQIFSSEDSNISQPSFLSSPSPAVWENPEVSSDFSNHNFSDTSTSLSLPAEFSVQNPPDYPTPPVSYTAISQPNSISYQWIQRMESSSMSEEF